VEDALTCLVCVALAACSRTALDDDDDDVHVADAALEHDVAAPKDAFVADAIIIEDVAPDRIADKRVFVTSEAFTSDLGGLAGADAKCQTLADRAGLGGTYMAWLSDDVSSPSSRFVHATVRYVRVDGVAIASDWNDLTDGTLAAPLDLTELGEPPSGGTECSGGAAWSDTLQSGINWSGYDYANCEGWTTSTSKAGVAAFLGQIGATNWWWSIWCETDCSGTAPLYCFEQ
jgi:hypothetical protein